MPKKQITRTNEGLRKHGEEDKEASHINPFEVLNNEYSHMPGRPYGEEKQSEINKEMNKDSNLRIKSTKGNRITDRSNDKSIINAINSDNKQLSQAESKRASNTFDSVQNSNLPESIKKQYRDDFCELKDNEGHVIVRKNASLNVD